MGTSGVLVDRCLGRTVRSVVPESLYELILNDPDRTWVSMTISQGGLSVHQYRTLIGYYASRRDWDAVYSSGLRAIEEHPDEAELLCVPGDVYAARGQWEQAADEWDYRLQATKHRDFLVGRRAWGALRAGNLARARMLVDGADDQRFPDIHACRLMLDVMDNGARRPLLLRARTSELLASHVRLAAVLYQPNLGITAHSEADCFLLEAWCPEMPTGALVGFVRSMLNHRPMDVSIIRALAHIGPWVTAAGYTKNPDLGDRVQMLRAGLKHHPRDGELLRLYAELKPDDRWLWEHIEQHRLSAPTALIGARVDGQDGVPTLHLLTNSSRAHEELEFTALGGAEVVGGSAYVLRYRGKSLLLDCGLVPGQRGWRSYPVLDRWHHDIHGVVISHGHLDHCCAIHKVVQRWPVPVHCSDMTGEFAAMQLSDMVGHRERDAGREIMEDTIVVEVLRTAVRSFVSHPFLEWFDVFPGCRCRLHPAGHIPGAAIVELDWDGLTIVYTGDFCLHGQLLTPGAQLGELPRNPDLLIMEATDALRRARPPYSAQVRALEQAVGTVLRDGGTALLPSFSIGRSQELVMLVAEALQEGKFPADTRLYTAGLASRACGLVKRNKHYGGIFAPSFRTFSRLNSRAVGAFDPSVGPSVVVASSGSLQPGSASATLAAILNADPRNGVFFSGHLDEESERLWSPRSNRVSHGARTGRYSLSAHASADDLLTVVEALTPRAVVLVHWGRVSNRSKTRQAAKKVFMDEVVARSGGSSLVYAAQTEEPLRPCSVSFYNYRKGKWRQ